MSRYNTQSVQNPVQNDFRTKGWRFHCYVKPQAYKINDPLIRAFNIFSSELMIKKDVLLKEFETKKIKQIFINTDPEFNIIKVNTGPIEHIFLKSKFLDDNRKFKQTLIDYYNSFGIFVNGPTQIYKRTGETTNKWLIELSPVYYNKN